MKYLAARFAAVYLLLGGIVAASIAGLVLGLVASSRAVTHTQLDAAISSAVGDSNVVRIAEQTIQQQAGSVGLLVTSQKVVSVHENGTSADVILDVATADPASGQSQKLRLHVQLSKSVYQVKSVTLA